LHQLQEHSSLASCLSLLEKENNQLREEKTKIEAEYMNDMQKLLAKMNEMKDDLEFRDDMIESLEAELRRAKHKIALCNCSQ
jgi:chromosome segregation ATPase